MIDAAFSRLLNARMAIQRTVAVSVLATLVLAGLVVANTLFTHLQNQSNQLVTLRQSAGNLQFIVDQKAAIVALNEAENANPPSTSRTLEGETAAIAQANLQNLLADIAQGAGAEITSVNGAAELVLDSINYVGVRAILSGNLSAIHKTIAGLENASPLLQLRDIAIQTSGNGLQSADEETILNARLDIYGAFLEPEVSQP